MGKLTKHLLRLNGWDLYGVAVVLPWIPIIVSRGLSMHENNPVPDPSVPQKFVVCIGYWHRLNWTSLVVLVPAALVILRWIANRLFPLGFWPNSYRICDRAVAPQTTILENLALDERNLSAALCIAVVLNTIDFWPVAKAYYEGALATRPSDWDWALWFLIRPGDAALRYENLILVIVAYACQFVIVLLAMMLIILLLRHNLFYLRLIYLRDRRPARKPEESIVLDFDDQDLRFGLLPLSEQFTTQIRLLAIVGSFTLFSRIVLSDVSGLRDYLRSAPIGDMVKIWGTFGVFVQYWTTLFPTPGQVLFPICWLIMFAVVLIPARAKLLPLAVQRGPRGGARKYLLELIPPQSKIDLDTQSLTKAGSVDETAKLFARHSFWPVGDTSAQFYSLVAFFVFFLILTPVLPSRTVILRVFIYYGLLVVMSYICSQFLFWIFAYRLKAVDPRLVTSGTDKN